MPSYADQLDSLLRSGGVPSVWNPVGSDMRGRDGDHIMLEHPESLAPSSSDASEIDEIDMIDSVLQHQYSTASVGRSVAAANGGEPDAWPDQWKRIADRPGHKSLWVLDTNVLISSLDLVRSLFDYLFQRNLAAYSDPSSDVCPAPICLVVPHPVLRELDAQKTSTRQTTKWASPHASHRTGATYPLSRLAREASRWILASLKAQRNATLLPDGTPLPASAWTLVGQSHSHFLATPRTGRRTNDEAIIAFCSALDTDLGGVVLLTNDVNAATAAEMEGVTSMDASQLMHAWELAQKSGDTWQLWIHSVVEQWTYQQGDPAAFHRRSGTDGTPDVGPPDVTGQGPSIPPIPIPSSPPAIPDLDFVDVDPGPPSPGAAVDACAPPPVPSDKPTFPPPLTSSASLGRTTSDSIHAPHVHGRARATNPAPFRSSPEPRDEPDEETLNPHVEWEAITAATAGNPRDRRRW